VLDEAVGITADLAGIKPVGVDAFVNKAAQIN